MATTPALPDVLSSYAGLLFLATTSIYAGSFASLPSKGDEDEEVPERISSEDAWWFPVLAGGALLSLYLAMRYLGPEWINWVIGWYFAASGILAVWKTSTGLARYLTPTKTWQSFRQWRFLVLENSLEIVNLSFRTPSLLLLLPSAVPSILYIFLAGEKKSALLSNILGLSFSYTALSVLRLDSFKTGTILLGALFFYDIFFVFGTNVMVSVATGLDVPIKLVWPKSLVFSSASGFSMLGLGDIVIPGAFVSLALRYDLQRSTFKAYNKPFRKPYFTSAIIAYIAGLVTTIVIMHTFKAAQPALLYLSPACILSFFITALSRGELSEAWAYEDGAPPKAEDAVKESPPKPKTVAPTDIPSFITVAAPENPPTEDTTSEAQSITKAKKRKPKKANDD